MKKVSLRIRNFDKERFLTFNIDNDASLDEELLDFIEDEEPAGVVPVIFEEGDEFDTFSYNITDKIHLSELSNQEINAEMVLRVLHSLVVSLIDMAEYRIPLSYLVLHRDYIYVDSDYKIEFICIPVEEMQEDVEINTFLRAFLASLRYELSENCNYVAKLLTYVNNGAMFNLRNMVTLVEELMEDMGIEIPDEDSTEIYADYQEVMDEAEKLEDEDENDQEDDSEVEEEESLEDEEVLSDEDASDEDEIEEAEASVEEEISEEDSETEDEEDETSEIDEEEEAEEEDESEEETSVEDAEEETEEEPVVPKSSKKSAFTLRKPEPEEEEEEEISPEEDLEDEDSQEEDLEEVEDFDDVLDDEEEDLIVEEEEASEDETDVAEDDDTGEEEESLEEEVTEEPAVEEKAAKKTLFKTKEATVTGVVIEDELDEFLAEKEREDQIAHFEDNGLKIKKNIKVNRASIVKNTQEELKAEEEEAKAEEEENVEEEEEEEVVSTSILSQTLGGTGILKGGAAVPKVNPYLIRTNTKERVMITKQNFKIGKASMGVDYTVKGNGAVSRTHAIITNKDGVYYIKDNKSTNHTYVNNKMVEEGENELLTHDCKIVLGDEEFTFKLR